jgi:hypothetical protein
MFCLTAERKTFYELITTADGIQCNNNNNNIIIFVSASVYIYIVKTSYRFGRVQRII